MASLSIPIPSNLNFIHLNCAEIPSTSSLSSSISPSVRVGTIAMAAMSSSLSSNSSVILPKEPKTPLRQLEKRVPIEISSSLSSTPSTPTLVLDLDPELDSKSEARWQLAKKYFDENKFYKADKDRFLNNSFKIIELLDLILKKHPTFLPALEMRLYIHRDKLQLDVAADFDTVRILSILKERLRILFDSKQYDEAEQKAKFILKLKPDDADAIIYMKIISKEKIRVLKKFLTTLCRLPDYDCDEALKVTSFILELQPNDAFARYCKIMIQRRKTQVLKERLATLFDLKQYDAAEKIIQALSSIDLEYADKYRGAIYVQRGINKPGATLLKAVLETMPEDKFTLLHLAQAHHNMHSSTRDENKQSLAYLKIILSKNPSDQAALDLQNKILHPLG